MQCMAGLDRLTSGKTWIGDTELTGLSEKQITQVRRDQRRLHLPGLQPGADPQRAREHPAAAGHRGPQARGRLDGPGRSTPSTCASASSTAPPSSPAASSSASRPPAPWRRGPSIVFADEPTGQLDSHSSAELLDFMRRAADDFGQTIVMVTHEPAAASRADQVLFLADGQIVGELAEPDARDDPRPHEDDRGGPPDMIVKQAYRNLLASKLRLFLTSLAVVLGVGFVVGAFVLGDTINKAFDGVFETANEGVAVQVRGVKTVSDADRQPVPADAAADDPRGRRRGAGRGHGVRHRPDHRQGRQGRRRHRPARAGLQLDATTPS